MNFPEKVGPGPRINRLVFGGFPDSFVKLGSFTIGFIMTINSRALTDILQCICTGYEWIFMELFEEMGRP